MIPFLPAIIKALDVHNNIYKNITTLWQETCSSLVLCCAYFFALLFTLSQEQRLRSGTQEVLWSLCKGMACCLMYLCCVEVNIKTHICLFFIFTCHIVHEHKNHSYLLAALPRKSTESFNQ